LTLKTQIDQCNATKIFESFISINDKLNANIALDSVVPPCTFPADIYISNKETVDPSFDYQWIYQNNVISTNPSGIKIPVPQIGIYEISLHVDNKKGCLSKITKKIDVNPNPKLLLTFQDSFCTNVNKPIYSSNSGSSFLWNFGPDAEPQTSNGRYVGNLKFNKTGIHTVNFKLTTETGCTKDTTFTIKTGQADAGFDVAPDVICSLPQTLKFTAKNKDYSNYLWRDSTTQLSTSIFLPYVMRDSFYYKLVDSIVMTLEVASKDGCRGTFTRVVKYGEPNAQFSINEFEGEEPFFLEVTDRSESLDTIVKWIYNWGDGTSTEYDINTINSAMHWYYEPGRYYVNLSVITKNGCKDDSYGAWITVHERPRVGPPSTCSASGSPKPYYCVNETVTFSATDIPPQMDAYQFEFGQHISHCENLTTHTYTIRDVPGEYTPAFIMENGGSFYKIQASRTLAVRGAKASIGYQMSCDDKYLVDFFSKSKGANTLKWVINGQIFTDSTFSYRFPAKGDYKVVLYAENTNFDCKPDSATVMIYIRDAKAKIKHADYWCPENEGLLDASLSEDAVVGCHLGYLWTFPKATNKGIIQTDNDSLYLYMPPGKHVISLEVRDVNGCRDTAYTELYVVFLKADFIADREAICQGSEVKFTSTSQGDVPIVNYDWNISPDKNGSTIQSSFDIAGKDSIFVKLVIKDQYGCQSSHSVLLPTYTPESNIKYNPVVCDGLSTVLIASDFTKYGSSLNYEWIYEDKIISTTSQAFLHKPKVGQHQVLLHIKEKSTACTNEYKVNIQSLNTPTAVITGVEDTVYCFPKTLQLNGNESKKDSGDLIFYKWNLDNNRSSNVINPISTYKKGRFTIALEVISKYGCRDTAYKDIKLVGPEGNLQADKNLVCKGEPITFTLKNPVDVSSFYWDFGQGVTSADLSPVSYAYNYVPESGKTNASLVLKSEETGCETIVVYPIFIHQVFASFEEDTVCGNTIEVKNTSKGAQQFQWTYQNNILSKNQSPTLQFDKPGKHLVQLSIKSDSTGCTDIHEGFLTTFAKPVINVPENINICGPEILSFLLDDQLKYQIKPPGLASIQQGKLIIYTSVDKSGWIIATTSDACKDSTFLLIDHLELDRSNQESNITTCGSTDQIDLEIGLQSHQMVLWTLNGFPIQDGLLSCTDCPKPNLLQAINGILSATVTDLKGCTEKTSNYIFTNLELKMPNVFSPNTDQINDTFRPVIINNQDIEWTDLNLKVWNRWGKKVYDGNQAWDGMIDGKPAPTEVYFFNVNVMVGEKCQYTAKGDVTLMR
jgi:gliding motility-associated-like protein